MKLVAIVLLLLACKDKAKDSPAPAPASGSAPIVIDAAPVSPAVDICGIGRKALEAATCPTPEVTADLMRAKKSLDGIVDTIAQLGAGGDQTKFQVMCATLLLALERDATKMKCTLSIDAAQRTEIEAVLEKWYAQRTPVTPTGDAAADAVIAKIAAVRDATCECRDGACLARLEKQLLEVGTMPASAPDAARTLGSKLLEDAARCANRVRTITDPPK